MQEETETGGVSPTLTGDHQNRVTDYTAIVVECFSFVSFGNYVETGTSATLRAKGANIMGGEVLIVEYCIGEGATPQINCGGCAVRWEQSDVFQWL